MPGLHRRKDGTLFPVEVHAGCFEADGQVRLLGLARDMTERRKMEEERAVALAKYRSLFDTLPVGVMIADNAGLIVESNRFVQQLLGVTAAELVGRAINDPEWKILRPDGSPMPPEEYASVRALREQCFIENTEKGLVRKTGEIVWISVTAAPLIAPNLGVVIVYSDVSARRRAAESLLRSEEKYRIVADNTFDWEFWLSPSGQYIYTSNSCERITGCQPADFEADPSLMARLVHPEDFDRFIAHQCVALRGQHEPEQEFRIIRPDREVRWIGHVCQPVRDQAGTFLGVRGSNRDITERKRAQDRLMSLNQCLLAFSPDSAENINNLVRFLGEKLGAACAFYVRLENERLHTVGGWNTPPGFMEPADPQASICLEVIRKADSAPKFIRDHAEAASPFRDPNFARRGLRACLGAAVRVGESSAGALCAYYHDDREPDSSDVDLLGIVASAVGAEEKRKQAESAFASEAARRQVLVDGSRDGIVFLDSEGRVVEANQRFAESLGYTAEEIQALHVWDWDRDWPRDRVLQSIRELGPEGSHFESRHWRKDGSCFDVIVSNSAAEVQGEKLVFCVCHDITELKQAESLLKESLLFRREAEAIARIGAWKVNPETGYLNATEGIHVIAEAPDDYSLGLEEALQLFDADSIPEIRAALLQAWQEGAPFALETGFTTLRGRHLWIEVRGLGRIEAASGAHVIGTLQDITERKQREKLNQLRLLTLELLATHAPLGEVLDSVVFQLECEHEDWIGSIMLVDEGRGRLVNGAAPRLPESFRAAVDGLAVAVGNGSCGTAAATGEIVIVEDIATHPYWVHFRELAREAGLRACWSIPISSAQGQVLGALAVYHRQCCAPSPEDFKAIQVVLDLARIAVSKLQAEEQLREREELFSSIVNQAGDAITVVDSVTGRFTQFNAAACQGLGYSKEEFAGLRVTDIQAEHSPEAVLENNVSALQLGGLDFETRHRHRDGSLRDVRVSLRPLQIRKRDFVAAVWTDITEAKRAETRAAGERRRTAFLLDLHQRAPQLTDRELYRHVLEQAVGLTESSGGVLRLTSHDQPVVTLTQGAPGDSEARLGDWVHALPGWGSTIRNVPSDLPAQPAFQRFMSVPVTQGLQDRMTLMVWDKELAYDEADLAQLQVAANELHKIMAQRAAQNLLRHSEQRFRHLVETTFDWIWEVDAAGCYTYASPKVLDLLGYAPEEVLGRTPFDLMPSAEARRVAAIFGEISAKREPFSGLENRNLHRSGREVVLETSGVPVLSDHGELLGYRGMDRDVTDRKRLESQLRQAQKLEAIGQLAGGVAHDFNNILAAILMQLGLIQMSPLLDPEINDAVCELEKGAQRAASLTRQLLMFSRRSVLDVKALDLNVVVANLLKMLGRLIGEDVKLVFEGHTGLPSVRADAGMLDQVLMNLVVNARDAMPRGGRIAITTDVVTISEEQVRQNANREAGRFVRLGVADTGCGMSKEVQDRIFEPFFTTKEPGKGTGLGLATVHGIVAQHQGWIEVESEPGRGATFLVFLPALDLPLAESNGDARSRPLMRGQEVVLLVEDETDLRRAAGQTLRALGYRVYEAENGQQAMILWQKHGASIDLLLTDMVMPEGMTGLELAERLHEMKPALRIIISSGYSTEIFQAGGIKQAGVWYLPKPYETHTLADAIRACFDRQSNEGRKGPPDAPESV